MRCTQASSQRLSLSSSKMSVGSASAIPKRALRSHVRAGPVPSWRSRRRRESLLALCCGRCPVRSPGLMSSKVIRDGNSLWPTVVGTEDQEADFRLDRAAREDAHAARNVGVLLAERLENAGERLLSEQLVDDDPEAPYGPCSTIKMTVRSKGRPSRERRPAIGRRARGEPALRPGRATPP